ncbi:MAG: radical SAM protein [Acidobacteriota bacterium]
MRVHLVNPSDVSFGVGVITPRWLYVLAAATPRSFGDPIITDETLELFEIDQVRPGDVIGIGIHTSNARRGYELGRITRERGATVIFGGIHATLYPEECRRLGAAHAVVKGDGDLIWADALVDAGRGTLQPVYEGGRVPASALVSARWDLLPPSSYMWASVQSVRGCPKHCSFCSVWRTDGQETRQRPVDAVIDEIVTLRRIGFRFVALADDNFYPTTLQDLKQASRRQDGERSRKLATLRQERFDLMDRLAQLPADMIFFTQITMEAAEDPAFLKAMYRANIKGALVGVESVTEDGLKGIYKDFNPTGDNLTAQLQAFRTAGVHVLGSFIFGLPSDQPGTFAATAELAERAGLTFAQFVPLTPFPGTVDYDRWEKTMSGEMKLVNGVPLTRHWLLPPSQRPKLYLPHPSMSPDEIRQRTQAVWDVFYSLPAIWRRSRCVSSTRARLAFVLISKLYRQMYANTGIATDSARSARSVAWARLIAKPCRRLFAAHPMPDLQAPSPAASICA